MEAALGAGLQLGGHGLQDSKSAADPSGQRELERPERDQCGFPQPQASLGAKVAVPAGLDIQVSQPWLKPSGQQDFVQGRRQFSFSPQRVTLSASLARQPLEAQTASLSVQAGPGSPETLGLGLAGGRALLNPACSSKAGSSLEEKTRNSGKSCPAASLLARESRS